MSMIEKQIKDLPAELHTMQMKRSGQYSNGFKDMELLNREEVLGTLARILQKIMSAAKNGRNGNENKHGNFW